MRAGVFFFKACSFEAGELAALLPRDMKGTTKATGRGEGKSSSARLPPTSTEEKRKFKEKERERKHKKRQVF